MKKEEIKQFVQENKSYFIKCAAVGAAIGYCIGLTIRNKELTEYAAGMQVKSAGLIKLDNGTDALGLKRHNGSYQIMMPIDEPVQELAS